MADGIKDGVYASVSGTVGRVFTYGGGKTGVEVHVRDERSQYPDRYTAFDVKDAVSEGDRVELRGWLSTRVEAFTKRDGTEGHGVKRVLNAPKLSKREPGDARRGQGAPQTQSGGDWATSPVSSPQAGAQPFGGSGADVPF